MTPRIVYWFRNDLRLTDNEAFFNAANSSAEVLPVFVFDPRQFEMTRLGFRRADARRAQFLISSVTTLRNALREKGSDLMVRIGDPEKIIPAIAEEFSANYVFASKEIAPEETRIESSLSKNLKIHNVDIRLFWMDTLMHPDNLPFPISKLPTNFNAYYEATGKILSVKDHLPEPKTLKTVPDFDAGIIPALPALRIDPSELNVTITQTGGENQALSDLQTLVENATSQDQVETLTDSGLSTWLSLGCLSPRLIYNELSKIKSTPIAQALVKDLQVRDYLHWTLLRFGPRLFKPSGVKHHFYKRWLNDTRLFAGWTEGKTEDAEVNALMNKLNATGYLSARERDRCANYLANELDLNWTWGAMYFESQLTDYDVSVIWGKWNTIAGVGEY